MKNRKRPLLHAFVAAGATLILACTAVEESELVEDTEDDVALGGKDDSVVLSSQEAACVLELVNRADLSGDLLKAEGVNARGPALRFTNVSTMSMARPYVVRFTQYPTVGTTCTNSSDIDDRQE